MSSLICPKNFRAGIWDNRQIHNNGRNEKMAWDSKCWKTFFRSTYRARNTLGENSNPHRQRTNTNILYHTCPDNCHYRDHLPNCIASFFCRADQWFHHLNHAQLPVLLDSECPKSSGDWTKGHEIAVEFPSWWSCHLVLLTPVPKDESLEHSAARWRLLDNGTSATRVLGVFLHRFASSLETRAAPAVLLECYRAHKSAMVRACNILLWKHFNLWNLTQRWLFLIRIFYHDFTGNFL